MLDKAEARQIAKNYANIVGKTLDPKYVVFFGSFVNGIPHEYSDIDIAVVFNSFQGNRLETGTLLQYLRQDVDCDLHSGIEPHLLDEVHDRSGFLEYIMKTGEIIYRNEELSRHE